MSTPRTILICVGSELLRGKVNTHASFITRRLESIGLTLHQEITVSDEQADIANAVRSALARFDLLIISGGLGPTFDDLTRDAVAEATGRKLLHSPALERGIRRKFKRAGYRMPAANTRQAYLIEGAEPIENKNGTAPGQWLNLQDMQRLIVLLPGPPSELYPMMNAVVLPRLAKRCRPMPTVETHLHFVGIPESVVDQKVRPIIARYGIARPAPIRQKMKPQGGPRVSFTILAHLGLVDLDVFVADASAARAGRVLRRIAGDVQRAVGKPYYGSNESYPLEKVVGEVFRRKNATLAVAESCTGGLLSSALTDVAGSSDYFLAGFVTYSNEAKLRDLGVPRSLLIKHGAVSAEVARAMANGARERAGATWGIGITGIAGPGGGNAGKPVGLVFISFSSKSRMVLKEFRFSGSRDAIRRRAVLAALDLLRSI